MSNEQKLKYEDLDPIKKAAVVAFLNEIVGVTFDSSGKHTTSTLQIFIPQDTNVDSDTFKCVIDEYNKKYEQAILAKIKESATNKVVVYPYITYIQAEADVVPSVSYVRIHTMLANVDDVQLFPLGDIK